MSIRNLLLTMLMVVVCAAELNAVLDTTPLMAKPFAILQGTRPGRPFFHDTRINIDEWKVKQVLIQFRDQVTLETVQEYISFLNNFNQKIYPYIHCGGERLCLGYSCAYVFECEKSLPYEKLEIALKSANQHFDPVIIEQARREEEARRKKEEAREKAKEEAKKQEEEKVAAEALLKRQLEEKRLQDEARKKEEEEVRRALAVQQAKIKEEEQEREAIKREIARRSPLWPIVRRKKYKELKTILKLPGVDLDIVDEGYTPLLYAVKIGDMESAALLIKRGASLTVRGPDGKDVMSYAMDWLDKGKGQDMHIDNKIYQVNLGVVKFMHIALSINKLDMNDYYAYIYWSTLIEKCDMGTIKRFLIKVANPNVFFWEGRSPLYLALKSARTDRLAIIKALLDAGVDPNAYIKIERKKILEIAVDCRNADLIDLLIEYGATL